MDEQVTLPSKHTAFLLRVSYSVFVKLEKQGERNLLNRFTFRLILRSISQHACVLKAKCIDGVNRSMKPILHSFMPLIMLNHDQTCGSLLLPYFCS